MRLLISACFLVLVGCGSESVPCSNCPSLSGTYAVSWSLDAGTATMFDGGSSVNPACPGPRPATWAITEPSNGQVVLAVGEVPLAGNYFDTYDVVLSGSGNGVSYSLRAIAIPEGGTLDAGIRLQGELTTRTTPVDGTDFCSSLENFTAVRSSR